MYRQPGYIDGRRARVGGVPIWGPVPSVLIPGTMEAYGIFDDFLSSEDLAANNSMPTGQATWEYLIATAGNIDQADEVGGAVTLLSPAADNQGGQIIMGSLAGGGAFFLAAGKHLWFEARAKVTINTATQFNHYIGLINPVNADILANDGAALPNNDMLGFVVRDGESNWSFVGDKAGAEDMNDLGAGCVVDGSYHYFGFYVNGVTDVTVYYDRAVIAAGAIATANIPVVGLMPAFAEKSGNAAGLDALTIDYIMCVQLR